MPKPISFGQVSVNMTTAAQTSPGVPEAEVPFRVAILGDFHSQESFTRRGPVLVDRDNFDEVLSKAGVEVRVPIGPDQTPTAIRFSELEDFHPDRLYQQLEVFQALKDLRRRLGNASTFATAAEEVRGWVSEKPSAAAPSQPAAQPAPVNPENLLEQILGEAVPSTETETGPFGAGEWNAYLRDISAPYSLPKVDYTKQNELLALVDEMTSRQMRAILHHPEFQAAESAWRGLFFLVRRLETGTDLKLYVLARSRAELARDLGASEDLTSTEVYRLLVEPSVSSQGGQPWAVLMGNYTFDQSPEDAELLGRMAKIAALAGAPFLTAASPRHLGCTSLDEAPDPRDWLELPDADGKAAWDQLRGLAEASYLGLALPRFLLRIPYGKNTDPIEGFDFREMPPGTPHEAHLWGNPAFVCVYLLGKAFSRQGWGFRPGAVQDVDGLPVHVYTEDGESVVKPCAEAWLTDRAADAILVRGLMPLLSVRGQDRIRLPRFESLAGPAGRLAGRW